MSHGKNMTGEMRECIQACLTCHAMCLETVQHCLGMGGEHANSKHIATLLACAEICQTSANFMLYGSEFHTHTCGVCAEVCSACADDCERLANGDETMRKCAQTCRTCARMCEHMSHHHAVA